MTNTPAEFEAYCYAHPTDRDGSSWDQKCVSLVFRAGGFWSSFTSAYRAAVYTRNAHGLDTTTPLNELPSGWFVYFDKAGPNNGHIGMTVGGGAYLSANWRYDSHGTALGVGSIKGYIDTGAVYMGASPYFGDATLDLSSPAGEHGTPLEGEEPMQLKYLTLAPYADVKGVIGDINRQFRSPAEREHFFAIWGDGKVWPVIAVDTAAQLATIFQLHTGSDVIRDNAATAIAPLLDDEAKVLAALKPLQDDEGKLLAAIAGLGVGGKPADLSPILAAIAKAQASIQATPAAVRAELARALA